MSKKKQKKKLATVTPSVPLIPVFRYRDHWLPLAVLFFFGLILYIQSASFDYVLDDKMVIVQNQFTQKGFDGISDIFKYESFRGFFGEQTDLLEGDRYRPLSIASFAVEQEITGGNKFISHLINILLYALTGLFIFRVLIEIFPSKPGGKWYLTIPFLASMIYLAHPLHTEVVANIKGRDEIFALIGELACLLFSFKYAATSRNRYLLFSFISIFLACLSKEGAITFLAVVPLTMYFFTRLTGWKIFLVTLPVLAGVLFYLAMRLNAIGYLLDDKVVTDLMNNPFYGLNFGQKTATVFYTLLLYLKLHLVPIPLTHDYYPYQVPVMEWNNWQPILSLIIHLVLLFVVIKGWKKKSVWAYCAAFYIITISIVSNLVVSVGTFMNERFVYHASLAFCIAAAFFISQIRDQKLKIGIATLLLLFFSFLTLKRLPDWKNEITLDASAIKNSPNSARSNCFYGVSIWQHVYLKIPAEDIPRKLAVLDSIKPYFEKSISIIPNYSAAQTMRAGVAAEYHKINNNYDSLIRVYESINLSGVNEPFVVTYLDYVNKNVRSKGDAEKLLAFYRRMKAYYPVNHPLHSQYRVFEETISPSVQSLPQ